MRHAALTNKVHDDQSTRIQIILANISVRSLSKNFPTEYSTCSSAICANRFLAASEMAGSMLQNIVPTLLSAPGQKSDKLRVLFPSVTAENFLGNCVHTLLRKCEIMRRRSANDKMNVAVLSRIKMYFGRNFPTPQFLFGSQVKLCRIGNSL